MTIHRSWTPLSPAWPAMVLAALLALLAACSGDGAPTQEPTADPTPTPAPATVETPAPATVEAPAPTSAPTAAPVERTVGLMLNEPGSFEGYTLFAKEDSAGGANAYLIDHQGRLVRKWALGERLQPALLLESGDLLAGRGGASVIAPDGSAVWNYARRRQHHDLLRMPNGNFLLLARKTLTKEEAVAAGANPEFVGEDGLGGDQVLEIRPTGASEGEVVWRWSVFDHVVQDFDPSKPNYGVVADHPELVDVNFTLAEKAALGRPTDRDTWTHANSLDYNAELDQIMISVRHFSEVWIIDHSASEEEAAGHAGGNGGKGGDLLYRWGNPRAHRAGTYDDQRLFWQHDAQWIPVGLPGAGNMLVFNNGNELWRQDRRLYSFVEEIALPSDGYGYRPGSEADVVWSYAGSPPRDFYSPNLSGAQRLPNGNTLIVNGNAGVIFEVASDGRKVWEYVNPVADNGILRQGEAPPVVGGRRTMRFANQLQGARRYAPDYPGLQALDLTPGAPIELPAG